MNSRKDGFWEKEDKSSEKQMDMPKRELMPIIADIKINDQRKSSKDIFDLEPTNPFYPFGIF